jgi:chemotaxis signal transduction protein
MNDKATSVRCMLLPLTSLNLLIPNSAVAEIIGYSTPRPLSDTSDWFPGVVLWRGVYNPEKDPDLPYIGIHMQDIPRAYLAEADSIESGSDEGLSQYLVTRVDDEQFARVIPDVDKIIADLKLEYNKNRLDELTR